MKNILVTGGAGFIGSNLIDTLLKDKENRVTCLDNFDVFYDPEIKKNNIKNHLKNPNYQLIKVDILDIDKVKKEVPRHCDVVIHLAAKVGVRQSINNPSSYIDVNINGTHNMLDLAKKLNCKKFIIGSSSSIYGTNPDIPWNENGPTPLPISPYACTKVTGELLGHTYSYKSDFQFIALRFFTVYGPGQRPDLAVHKFAKKISEGKPIDVYGNGKTKRDYTYIDDIVMGIRAAMDYSDSNYEIINLGSHKPVALNELIYLLEKILRKKAILNNLPEQPGDVPITYANINKAQRLLGYKPKTNLQTGLKKFVYWFKKQNEKYK